MKKFLYFRNVTDQDVDDSYGSAVADSVLIESSRLRAMIPQADNALDLFFETTMAVWDHDGARNVDVVRLSITTHRHKEVMMDIVNAINQSNNGFIIVADDVTTTYLTNPTGPADETVAAEYLSSNITGVAAIAIADPVS